MKSVKSICMAFIDMYAITDHGIEGLPYDIVTHIGGRTMAYVLGQSNVTVRPDYSMLSIPT